MHTAGVPKAAARCMVPVSLLKTASAPDKKIGRLRFRKPPDFFYDFSAFRAAANFDFG